MRLPHAADDTTRPVVALLGKPAVAPGTRRAWSNTTYHKFDNWSLTYLVTEQPRAAHAQRKRSRRLRKARSSRRFQRKMAQRRLPERILRRAIRSLLPFHRGSHRKKMTLPQVFR